MQLYAGRIKIQRFSPSGEGILRCKIEMRRRKEKEKIHTRGAFRNIFYAHERYRAQLDFAFLIPISSLPHIALD